LHSLEGVDTMTVRKRSIAANALIGFLAVAAALVCGSAGSSASAATTKGHAAFVRGANAICKEANAHTSGAEVPGDPGDVTAAQAAAWGEYMQALHTAGERAQAQFAALKVPKGDAAAVRRLLERLDAYVQDMQTVAQVAAQDDLPALQAAVGKTYDDEVAFKNAAAVIGAMKCAA
jgi:hypothetical protein